MPVPFGTRVHVWIGDPIPRHDGEDRAVLLDVIENQIRSALGRYRIGA